MGGLEFKGDWDKFKDLRNIPVVREMGNALEIAGEILRGNVIKGIRDQKWNFKDLAESTKREKERKNKSPLILISEGDYLSSFTTEVKKWNEIHVGSNHPQSRALEFGYAPRRLPARPHVGPATAESLEEIIEELTEGLSRIFNVR